MSTPSQTIPAATLVIFRHGINGGAPELLMVQRSEAMRFAGGAAVFPGGRVDPEDHALAARIMADSDPADAAARIAAMRETLEETGLALGLASQVSAEEAREARALLLEQGAIAPVLERFGWRFEPSAFVPFAHWCPNWPRAFDTRFYLTDLGTGAVDIAVDETENTHLFWASAAEALAMAERGEIGVIFPTRLNLERLARFASFAEARVHAHSIPVTCITPRLEMRDESEWLVIPEGLGYPVTGQLFETARRA